KAPPGTPRDLARQSEAPPRGRRSSARDLPCPASQYMSRGRGPRRCQPIDALPGRAAAAVADRAGFGLVRGGRPGRMEQVLDLFYADHLADGRFDGADLLLGHLAAKHRLAVAHHHVEVTVGE